MPQHCAAIGCKNRATMTDLVTFHCFPKNTELRLKWMKAVRRLEEWQPSKHTKLCSLHFQEKDIDRTSLACVRIREGAVPTIFPYFSTTVDQEESFLRKTPEDDKPGDGEMDVLTPDAVKFPFIDCATAVKSERLKTTPDFPVIDESMNELKTELRDVDEETSSVQSWNGGLESSLKSNEKEETIDPSEVVCVKMEPDDEQDDEEFCDEDSNEDSETAAKSCTHSNSNKADTSATASMESVRRPVIKCKVCQQQIETEGRPYKDSQYFVHCGVNYYVCNICHGAFSQSFNLNSHYKRVHKSVMVHVCQLCGQPFALNSALSLHYQRVHEDHRPFTCKLCHLRFSREPELRNHLNCVHLELKPYSCDVCHRTFGRKSYLVLHYKQHTEGKSHACDKCDKSYYVKRHLQVHYLRNHSPVCRFCKTMFEDEQQLAMHVNYKHSNQTLYSCDTCGKQFTKKTYLQKHQVTLHLGLSPFICDICYKSFRSKFHLANHMVTHSGERPFHCEYCPKKYTQKVTLVKHLKSAHNQESMKT